MNNNLIDFHAHILPGADHGSGNLETSLRQLALIQKAPVSKIVATPHFYPHKDTVGQFLERREKSVQILRPSLSIKTPEVLLGAEVLLCPGLDKMPGLEELCIKGTRTLLIEMPFLPWSRPLMDTVENLLFDDRYTVVFAHIDRYLDKIEYLEDYDYIAQLNVSSLKSRWNRKKLLKLVAENKIHAVGSDLHGMETGYDFFVKYSGMLGDQLSSVLKHSEAYLSGAVALNL